MGFWTGKGDDGTTGLFFGGQFLDRSALDALLGFAERQAGSVRTNLHLLWHAVRSPLFRAQAAD